MEKTIYLAQAEGTDNYKIGVTTQKPKKRLKQLQTGNSFKLVLIHKFETKYGNKFEATLHKQYCNKKIEGEWFLLDYKDVKNFINRCEKMESNFDFLMENNSFFQREISR